MLKRAIGIALLLPLIANAQESGWSALGSVLGGGIDREGAYMEGQRQRAEIERQYWEERARLAKVESERLTEQTREWLARQWVSLGFNEESAKAIAAVYSPSAMDEAIIATTRSNGSVSAVTGIRKALDDYNYELANRLAIAWLVVRREEQNKSSQNAP